MDITQKKENNTEGFSLEESDQKRKEIDRAIFKFANNFINSISKSKAFNSYPQSDKDENNLFEIGAEPQKINEILDFFKEHVVETGLNPASGSHFGYIPGGGLYSSALGDYLAAVTNRFAGVFYASPGAVKMENALIEWGGNLIGYAKGFSGNLTSGGSIANLIALYTAKKSKKITSKNLINSVIYCSQQTHHSIYKAINIVGLEECILRRISLDQSYRLSASELKNQIDKDIEAGLNPFLVIGNAGSTDVGAIDPLDEIALICKTFSIWFHVDAAYGGFFMLTALGKSKLSGLENADSVILDPHKGLFLPYGSGMVLVKEKVHLLNANKYSANYMQDATAKAHFSPADLSPELSKHFRGLRMWLPMKLYGPGVFSFYLEEKLQLTTYLHRGLKQLGFKIVCEPDLTVIAFRLETNEHPDNKMNKAILEYILGEGRVFLSSTVLEGHFTLRAAILSFRTHKKEVDQLLEVLEHALKILKN